MNQDRLDKLYQILEGYTESGQTPPQSLLKEIADLEEEQEFLDGMC